MSNSNSKHRASDSILLVYAIAVYIVLFAPIVTMMVYSFNGGRLLLVWQEFSLDPYRRLFSNAQLLNSVKTSLQVAAVAAVLATVLGSLAGLHLARHGGWSSRIFVGLDRKSTRLNSSHIQKSRMPSSA